VTTEAFRKKRELMVENHLIPRGIRDERVLDAMRRVPRHLFVDADLVSDAYKDTPLPLSDGQTISQPYIVALMTELLELKGAEKVLEIGTGSGYQGAVLAELSKEVYSVERIESLAERARAGYHKLSYHNIHVKVGDGSLGWPEKAPFDRIIVTAATPAIPEPLLQQLADGGILVIPVGSRFSQQILKVRKISGGIKSEYHIPCVFVPLIGKYGWEGKADGDASRPE
jgi:protein-L-isoaspartate(D-aspartate) O-methyltransferase